MSIVLSQTAYVQ